MPVRAKTEEWLLRQFIGSQVFRHGEPITMGADDFYAVLDFVQEMYGRMVNSVDWNRVQLEASSRCIGLDHDHLDGDIPCGESLRVVLLTYDRPYGEDWADAETQVTEPPPNGWSLPTELPSMFAAWVRARRKSLKES